MALDTSMVITSPYDEAIQELDLLMSTENTEVLGNTNFGVNMEQFLWQMTPSPSEVKSYLQKQILANTFWCNKLGMTIDVSVDRGTIRDIYEVTITLTTPNEGDAIKRKTYTFR